jgi:hypothetical protein
MDFERLFNDSIENTRVTFAGHWDRWLILALLGAPFTLIRFLFDPEKIIVAGEFRWDLVPWGSIAALVIAGIIGAIFIAGYTVRIYRGTRPSPGFTGWPGLFVEGIKLDIVIFIWYLPAIIVGLLLVAFFLGGLTGQGFFPGFASPLTILGGAALLLVALVLLFIASLCVTMGAVRFARTGSMAEGWRYSAVTGLISRLGWGHYFLALVLLGVAGFLYGMASFLPASIPYVGWLVPVALAPFFTIFAAWYVTLIYEAGEVPPAAPPAATGP